MNETQRLRKERRRQLVLRRRHYKRLAEAQDRASAIDRRIKKNEQTEPSRDTADVMRWLNDAERQAAQAEYEIRTNYTDRRVERERKAASGRRWVQRRNATVERLLQEDPFLRRSDALRQANRVTQ